MDRKLVLNKITAIDGRIMRMRLTANNYYKQHGVHHSGMNSLIMSLLDERSNLRNQLRGKLYIVK